MQDEDRYYAFIGSAWVLTNLSNINSLTEDSNPDGTNDFLITYDASASDHKKVKHGNTPGSLLGILEDQQTAKVRVST